MHSKQALDAAAGALPQSTNPEAPPPQAVLWVQEKAAYSDEAAKLTSETGYSDDLTVACAGTSYQFSNRTLHVLSMQVYDMVRMARV
jgi:hypothetical protein